MDNDDEYIEVSDTELLYFVFNVESFIISPYVINRMNQIFNKFNLYQYLK